MRHARWQTVGLALALLALVALPGFGAGQDNHRWTQFKIADGLPSDTVWAIAVSPKRGDVWLGTSGGASVYRDGRWYSYSHEHGLGADWVAALAVDSQERVWFGTFGGGLTVLDGERWQTYTTANSGLGGNWISALALGPQGEIWCGTWGGGLSLFDGNRWVTYNSGNSPLPADYVTALAAAPDGSIWIGLHGHGLAHLANGGWTLLSAKQGLADDFVNAVAVGSDGHVWVGTAKGLNRLDPQGQLLATYTPNEGLPDERVQALTFDAQGHIWAGTAGGAAVLEDDRWTVYHGPDTLAHDYVSAIAAAPEAMWFGSLSAGVARFGQGTVASARRLPVVLVHGWHGVESDRLEDSEFRFLASWLREDGYPVYYAQGISPQNTLHENAARLRAAIDNAKRETGAARVDIIAFSMGGLNTRAYVESSLYAGDVDQAFIMGTPEAGVHLWYPFLLRELHEWSRDPSAVELTPEYASLFNDLHRNGADVPYMLIAGRAQDPQLPETIAGLPPSDALIETASALALDGPRVDKVVTGDLHAFSNQSILLGLPSYLWPRDTYDAYIRNRLRLGPEAQLPGVARAEPEVMPVPEVPMHSPFYSGEVTAERPLTFTVPIDTQGEVRFYLRGQSGPLTFSLIDPQGHRLDDKTVASQGEYFDLGMADVQAYLIHQARAGLWKAVVGRPADAQGAVRFTGYATFSSPIRLSVGPGQTWYEAGQPVVVTATLHQGEVPLPQAKVEAEIGRPDRQIDRLSLADDGAHNDGAAGDGVYGATYQPAGPGGYYTLFVTASGTVGNVEFARTAERLLAISPGSATLTGSFAEGGIDADRDGRFEALALQAGVDVRAAGNYLLASTLCDSQGREISRVVEPLTLDAGAQTVTLSFPGRALAQAQVDGPYIIRRVMLLDEAGAALPLQQATDVLKTRPYRYQDFEGS